MLDRADVAEEIVSSFVLPLAKATLTLGKVDGAGGRGSFSGIASSLRIVLGKLGPRLLACVRAGESSAVVAAEGGTVGTQTHTITQTQRKLDLVALGVWAPVSRVLGERFSHMFGVGIAATLHMCYQALQVSLNFKRSYRGGGITL